MLHSHWSYSATFPAEERTAARSRTFVRSHLQDHDLPEMCADVEVVTSELVTNAVRHAGTGVTLGLTGDAHSVRISVQDGGVARKLEALPPGHWSAGGGRGLLIVSTISSDWGVERGAATTMVWACFDIPPQRR